jgi:nucleotide-binding universal stress UspA family protein
MSSLVGDVRLCATTRSPSDAGLDREEVVSMTVPTSAIRRVVVGVDGSPAANAALTWAVDAAHRRGVPLHVVHAYLWPVYPPPLVPGSEYVAAGEAGERLARQVLDAALEAVRVQTTDLAVTGEIVKGPSAEVLLKAATDGAALLVVGSRGRGGFRSLLLGSTSTEVAAKAHCPVAVVRRGETPSDGHSRVIVGVDGSELSEAAVAFAMAEASMRNAAVEAITAWNRVEALPPGLIASGVVEAMPTTEEIALALSESLAGWRERFPDVPVTQRVVVGHPAHVLSEASKYADLVVVGTRGHGAAASMLIGSTSRGLLHHAQCPVVVVPVHEELPA